MTWVAVAIIGGSVVGAVASNRAGRAQERAAGEAVDLQQEQFDRTVELNAPFREAGLAGQNRLLDLLGLSDRTTAEGFGRYSRDFSAEDFQADPGYAFRLSEGIRALERQMSAGGRRFSGGALRAATEYGQNFASNEYTNAFNRYQVNRGNQINPLLSLSDRGQTATNTVTQAGDRMTTGSIDAIMGGANARGSSYVGGANAINSGIGNYLNWNFQNQAINNMGAIRPFNPVGDGFYTNPQAGP
jgi:hypothetical protein